MAAHKTPGRDIYDEQLAKLGPLPQFYSTLVNMERQRQKLPTFTAERIRRARTGKAVDFEVLEVLQKVAAEYSKIAEPVAA
ncbi:hypothetical protein GCM10027048_28180 [Hymenobacter coalescens]